MKFKYLWIFSCFILLLACNDSKKNVEEKNTPVQESKSTKDSEISGTTTILEGTWMLKTFNKETIETTDAYKIPTLEIEEGKIVGNAGCNKYSGKIEVKGDKVKIEAEKDSKLDCPERALEDDFLKGINAKDLRFKMQDENQLIFYTDDLTMMFEESR